MTRRNVDEAIAQLARSQHGVFTFAQALGAGADSALIQRRLQAGLIVRLGPHVYALRDCADMWRRRLAAAHFAHPQSVVSGRSALRLHELPLGTTGLPQLTVPSTCSSRSSLARLRRTDGLPSVAIDGFRVVTAEQAVCDVAAELGLMGTESVLDQGLVTGRIGLARFQTRVAEWSASRRPGSRILRCLAEDLRPGRVVAANQLERTLYRILGRALLPPFEPQAPAPWDSHLRLDALIPSWRLVIEGDGRRWHTRVVDFERDRRRDQQAGAAGYLTLRFTWTELCEAADEVVQTIRSTGSWREAA